jgi:hypothetical protein
MGGAREIEARTGQLLVNKIKQNLWIFLWVGENPTSFLLALFFYNVIIIHIEITLSMCYNYIINERRNVMVKPWDNANCYGYAIDTNRWFHFEGNYENAYEELLDKNPHWMQVQKKDMVLGKSYVAFRFGYHDFHFIFRDHKGHWTHKMGSLQVKPISQKDVFHKFWRGNNILYTSKICLFEVPNR